jgi:hypothetical protein
MKYEEISPMTRDEAEEHFLSNDLEKVCYAMIGNFFLRARLEMGTK